MKATPEELAQANAWVADRLQAAPALPFSFTYGGRPSAELLSGWQREQSTRKLDEQRTEHTTVYTDPDTGLVLRWVLVEYHDYPTVEWTLYFQNTGAVDTPILADIQAVDVILERSTPGAFTLHHHTGSPCLPSDYQPFKTTLYPPSRAWQGATAKRINTAGGRPTNSDLPYFNIEGEEEGLIVVIGWPGQWAAEFTRLDENRLQVRGGQELTHFTLHPEEEVRSPLIALQFWQGERVRSQNIWRRWMIAHNLPQHEGRPLAPQMAACSSHQYSEMIHANEENQKLFVDRYLEEQLPLDYWWMDAGWYPNNGSWVNTGTWEVDTGRFPKGLRAVSDHAHAKGVKIIVWFEPERVTPGTWLYEERPEWLLELPQDPALPGRAREQRLLNLGHPEALQWLIEHVNCLLVEQGIDLYRQDFNIDPLPFWRAADAPDRQGITEIRYVTGYLAYWDGLRRHHPGMLIDSCASGGRRNDLETLRRAVPLLRSDHIFDPIGNQGHTYGLASWLPYYGTGVISANPAELPYNFHSLMCPHLTGAWDMRLRDIDYDLIRRLVGEWQEAAPYFLGDYYPLTSYSLEKDVWMAWQFDRPDLGGGIVQVFRRAESPYDSARFQLQGLDAEAEYTFTGAGEPLRMTGRQAMAEGLPVRIAARDSALLVRYQRV